jgi:hypothetical protein
MYLFTYQINNLAEDFEKKLSLYSNRKYLFGESILSHHERYEKFVEIIINKNDLDLNYMINRLERYYKSGISVEQDKLKFDDSEINAVCSILYKELYYIHYNNTFNIYLDIIKNKLHGNMEWWLDLSFDNESIKSNFLDAATKYIIENQNKSWISEFEKIDYERYNWLPHVETNQIPEQFNDLSNLYFWFKNNKNSEVLHFIGSSLIEHLLYNVIRLESYNIHSIEKNRILQILESCQNDYITIGYILTNNDLNLNSFFLKQPKYVLYGFLNLYNSDNAPHNLSDKETNYTKEWHKILSQQLVNLSFMHFYNLQYRDKFGSVVFQLINFLAKNYVKQYNNPIHYKANHTFSLVLKKISNLSLKTSQYEKTYLFDLVIEEVVTKQLKNLEQNKFDEKTYFLLSYYLEQIDIKSKVGEKDYKDLKEQTTEKIINNLSYTLNKNFNNIYIDFGVIEKIDFALMYQLSADKDAWLQLININTIKKDWQRIIEERKGKKLFNSSDPKEPRDQVKLYFKILLIIFKKTENKNVAKYINQLAIEFGLAFELGIFTEYSFERNGIYDEYLELLNLFDDDLFNKFLNALNDKNNLKDTLQLFNHTISKTRKKVIEKSIEQIADNLTEESTNYFDIRESISYALSNGFHKLSTILIDLYKNKIESTKYKHKDKEFYEMVCQKELLDIYYEDVKNDEKFTKLNSYKIPFDDKNLEQESKKTKCENYKDFIRAILFFEDKPIKTYKILSNLLDKEVNSLYFINMLNAYFNTYENDENKEEKFSDILEKYNIYAKRLQNHQKSLFEYQTLLYGYSTIKDEKKFLELWLEMPKQYQYDFKIFEIRCQFLQGNNQPLIAKDYINEFKRIYTLNQEEQNKIVKIENKLDKNIKIEVETKLNLKIDFSDTTLTIKDAQNYWLQIKDMTDEEHAQIFSKNDNVNEFIKDIILNISKELLNRKINIQRQKEQTLEIEDIINDWFKSLIEQRMSFLNWHAKDQTRGGQSFSGENVGEKDLEVFNAQNDKLFLFEAFRLFNANKNVIKEHINKLDGYNADGCHILIVMAYTHVNDFVSLCNNYQEFLKTFNYKGFDKLTSLEEHSFDMLETKSSKIKLLKEVRYKNKDAVAVYHFLLDFQ